MTFEDFNRIPELRKLIAFEWNEVETAFEQATNMSVKLTGMPHGGGSAGSVTENAVLKAQVHRERYDKYCAELSDILKRLAAESKSLKENQRKVVEKYYIENKRVGRIAEEMKLTEQHVFRLRKEAVHRLCNILP